MPDTTVLEVREPRSTQARTFELGAPSVRIGRGPQCEVRLGEPSLAEVQCLLRRRGDTWHVQPVGPPGYLSIQGRPVESQRPLPMGEPMRVGDHWLMLSRLRDEDRERIRTVSASPSPTHPTMPTRSVEPSRTLGSVPPSVAKPSPASRLVSSRPDDRRWEERPLVDRFRQRPARPDGPSADRGVRQTRPTIPPSPSTPPPIPTYESKVSPPPYPLSRGARPNIAPAPAAVTNRAPAPDPTPKPSPSPLPSMAPPPRLGCSTVVRDEPTPASAMAAIEPASLLASLPGLEALAAQLIEQARASSPSPSPFSATAVLSDPSADVMDVEVIEPEPEPETENEPESESALESESESIVLPSALGIGDCLEPEAVEAGPTVAVAVDADVDLREPATMPAEDWFREPAPAESGPGFSEPSAPPAETASVTPVPQIAITFDHPPVGLHRYLASVRRRRRSAPVDPMAQVVEAMPVVPTEPESERVSEPDSLVEDGVEAMESAPVADTIESPEVGALSAEASVVEPSVPSIEPESEPEPEPVARSVAAPASDSVGIRTTVSEPLVVGDWPTARSILDSAARLRAVEAPRPSSPGRRSSATLPVPTVARAPSQWGLPGLLWVPAMVTTMALGGVGVWLSACQTEGLMAVGSLANRAVSHQSPTVGDQLQAVAPSRLSRSPSWWNSPAETVWPRAWALDAVETDGEADPAQAEAVREWLDRARATAPALPPVRYALVSHATADNRDQPERWPVGLGRDVLSRAILGRRLLDEGKTEAGQAAYREALAMACRARELDLPPFDDKETRRYRLPEEPMVELVVGDLARRSDLKLADWLALLGDRRLPMLVAGRLLRARGQFDGDRLLEKAAEPPAEGGTAGPWDAAASAEALALLSRFDVAETAYQEALDALPDGSDRRILLHNLADIRRRLGDEAGARSSLKAACGDGVDDPIGRRALRVIAEIDRARRGTSIAESRGGRPGRKPANPPR